MQTIAAWLGGNRLDRKARPFVHVNVRTKFGPPESCVVCRFENPRRYAQIPRRRLALADIDGARIVKSGTRSDELIKAGTPAEAGAAAGPSASSTFDLAGDDAAGDDVLGKGTSVGRYLVLEQLGAGAMGVVYAAYDPELDRKVALKLLRTQQGRGADRARRQERLVREAKAIAKLSHPNVVGIFDVGVHDGQVFMAMEYLGGGTLRDWMNAQTRPWREIVKMFVEVGQGLAAAHVEGLVHRDFKPDNVLLDKQGKPKVADFGLVRVESTTSDTDDRQLTVEEQPGLTVGDTVPVPLTRTGAIAGTPAYMAPEQFLGKPIDARTDQFALCVALYEALYGERPFAGESVIALAGQVTKGHVRATPKDSDVPGWVRKVLVRGLGADPSDRFASVADLLGDLASDPGRKRLRFLSVAGVLLLVAAVVAVVARREAKRRGALDAQVASHVLAARTAYDASRSKSLASADSRRRALEAFDLSGRRAGEASWQQHLQLDRTVDSLLAQAELDASAARTMSPTREVAQLLEQIRRERLRIAESHRRARDANEIAARLVAGGGTVAGRVTLSLHSQPDGATVWIETLAPDAHGRRQARDRRLLGTTPAKGVALDAASYRLTFEHAGRAPVTVVVLVERGEALDLNMKLPREGTFPRGFVYVPPGRFLFGTSDEDLRTSFLDTVPLHETQTKGFLIGVNEVTFAEWIDFMKQSPAAQRRDLTPRGREPNGGGIELRPSSSGDWELSFTPWSRTMRAARGLPLTYPERTVRRSQDWTRFPVTGITPVQASEYARWLARTGRLPGARLCTEKEWERAARGADDREFPQGDSLNPGDANFDATYGHQVTLFGLDEVGSYPASTSVFGVRDMAGNAFEFTQSVLRDSDFVARGGCYYQAARAARSTNRAIVDANVRGQALGFRVCADVDPRVFDD
jgi:formylglycine-generating enzyme required for sulfatase activity/tRNA A-37 threonylcarbamoyl transferase component Bud32